MAVSFDKKRNALEVGTIFYSNNKFFYDPSKPEKFCNFSKVNERWYLIADTTKGVEFYAVITKNVLNGVDSYKRPNWTELVIELIPVVNGQPDYNNKLIKSFNS